MKKEDLLKDIEKYIRRFYGKPSVSDMGVVWYTLCFLEENGLLKLLSVKPKIVNEEEHVFKLKMVGSRKRG